MPERLATGWLRNAAIGLIAGFLAACSLLAGESPEVPAPRSTTTPAPAPIETGAASVQSEVPDPVPVPIALTEAASASQALLALLETDPEILSFISADPLINDGGAVFLGEEEGESFEIQAVEDGPRWKRLELRRIGGAYDDGLRCTDPAAIGPETPAGFRSICLDAAAGTADVTVAHHLAGTFLLDRPPYARTALRDITQRRPTPPPNAAATVPPAEGRLDQSLSAAEDVGLKPMDLLSVTRARFAHTDAGWRISAVSTTRVRLLAPASQSVEIAGLSIDAADGTGSAAVEDPAGVVRRSRLEGLPRGRRVVLRVKVAGATEALVFAEPSRGRIARLRDDGSERHGDRIAGDGEYAVRLDTPADSRAAIRLLVHAFAARTLADEATGDYDADTWIVPLRIE